jgi:predicted transposase YdaD
MWEKRNMLTGWDWDRAKIVWQREAREDGLIAGRLEGEKRGRLEGMREAVVKFQRFGLPPADIAKALDLPEAEVARYLGKA